MSKITNIYSLRILLFGLLLVAVSITTVFSQTVTPHADRHIQFRILPLGTSGGELEDNLSAYLIAPVGF